jgi:DNA-binding Lrp family transcriptional regulator
MSVDPTDRRLLAALEDGLPLVRRPYAEIARRLDLPEAEVIDRLRSLLKAGVIRRFGVVVRHHELGYQANAMVVWDIPEDRIDAAAGRIVGFSFVTLCYHRPRRPPAWPFTVFCMIHGKDRQTVLAQIAELRTGAGLEIYPHAVLFSRRRFKQSAACYGSAGAREVA